MINSHNPIQINIKFSFTVYEYIIVFEYILLSNLIFIYINFVFFVHCNIVATHTHNPFQLVLLVETVYPIVNMIQVINKVNSDRFQKIALKSSYRRSSIKKAVLEFSNIIRKTLVLESATLLKKNLWHRCFPVNFTKFLRTPFLQNTSGQPLLLFSHKTAYFSNNSHNACKNADGNSSLDKYIS